MCKWLVLFTTFLIHAVIVFGQTKSYNSFIPVGFTILDSAIGDINKDGIKDAVLILKVKNEAAWSSTVRPLLVLEGNKRKQFKLVARNDHVVMCWDCGGVHGDPYVRTVIKNGYFSVEHFGGSGWRWTRVITFKFNSKTQKLMLHRDAGHYWHVSEDGKKTERINGEKDFDKLPFDKYDNVRTW
ncbi:MAG: hypothetical protein V4722_18310 [Bacteroidota bacterium]